MADYSKAEHSLALHLSAWIEAAVPDQQAFVALAVAKLSERGPPRDEVKLKQVFSRVHNEALLARPEIRSMMELISADASDEEMTAQRQRWRAHTGKMIELVKDAIVLVDEPELAVSPAMHRLARAVRVG